MEIRQGWLLIDQDTVPLDPTIDHWVYPNGRYLAMIEAGQRLPLTPANQNLILLAGGVRVNGQTLNRKPYPFWQFDTLSRAWAPEEHFVYTPFYRYFPDTLLQFPFQETFESPQLSLRLINVGDAYAASLTRDFENPRRGFWCGKVTMGPNQIFQAEATTPFEFPMTEVWLEISLRGDRNLAIGLTKEAKQNGNLAGRDLYLLLSPPSDRWQTFYVNLTPWLQPGSGLFRYRLYLSSMGDTTGQAYLYLDDLRILYFKP